MSKELISPSLPLPPDAVAVLIGRHFSDAKGAIGAIAIEACGNGRATVRLPYEKRFARPGGTVSGPTMFMLADITCYTVILSDLGEAALDAVTTTLTINFLARPAPGDLVCTCEFLRQGRRQVVCDTRLYASDRKLVAQASCIYALPIAMLSNHHTVL